MAKRPIKGSLFDFNKTFLKEEKSRDLSSGMEILETGFLLGIIEGTKSKDKNDLTMRKLSFNELVRRGELSGARSEVLKLYAKDTKGLYGKDIQCAAMRELGRRTQVYSGGRILTVQRKFDAQKEVKKEQAYEEEKVLSV